MITRITRFYVLIGDSDRVGEGRNSDKMTEQEKQRVRTSAQHNLRGVKNFDAVFYGGLSRARGAVETVLAALSANFSRGKIHKEEGFGYQWVQEPALPQFPVGGLQESMAGFGAEARVYQWFLIWAPAMAIRGRFMQTLLSTARILALREPKSGIRNVLVGSHSPTAELAVLSPREFPCPGSGDIIIYDVRANSITEELIGARYLPCPPAD